MVPKRPRYDPQHSYDGGEQSVSQRLLHPRFDPQSSHDNTNSPPRMQHQDQRPSIPAPEFTGFDMESALPPVGSDQEPSILPQIQQPRPTPISQKADTNRYHTPQHLQQSATSSFVPVEEDLWTSNSRPPDPQTAFVPSPEQQHSTLLPHDGQSISATDLSSDTAGNSTPESKLTSNSSDKEGENQINQSRLDQHGDDSFYWHSGRSSSDVEEERSQGSPPIATNEEASIDQRSSTTNSTVVPREHRDLPIRSTSLSPSISAPYGASALGFGGPSDWEYFGDYEAEEIDDEELYSRPRNKDSSTDLEASAELPAPCPPTGITHYTDGTVLPPPKPATKEIGALREPSSARQVEADHSNESPTHHTKAFAEGEPRVGTKAILEHSMTTAQPSSRPVASSDLPPDQNPDLDEVIRAWSEAPYVGKSTANSSSVPDKEFNHKYRDDDPNPSSIPMPREGMLDPIVLLKATPAFSPLPAFTDHAQNQDLEERPCGNYSNTLAIFSASLIPQSTGEQELDDHLAMQLEPVPNSLDKHKEIASEKVDLLSQGQKNHEPQKTEPLPNIPVVSPSPSTTIFTEPAIAKGVTAEPERSSTPKHVSAKVINSVLEPDAEATLPVVPAGISSQENEEFIQGARLAIPEKLPQSGQPIITQDPFQTVPEGDLNESSSSELARGTLGDRLTDPSSRVPVPVSQESSEVIPVEPSQDLATDSILKSSMDIPHRVSLGTSESAHGLPPSSFKPQEALRISHSDGDVGGVPTNIGAAEAGITITTSSTNVDVSKESESPTAPKLPPTGLQCLPEKSRSDGKIHDPYADLDPWGKASLNRFAAMLREESRADTNKDKLNIFNVFTSRESRLRVVLYGTEDELINTTKPAEQGQTVGKEQETAKMSDSAKNMDGQALPTKSGYVKEVVQRANTLSLQRSLKALPALPANRESVIGLPGNALAPLVIQEDSKPTLDHESPRKGSLTSGAQYSPGGRPTMAGLRRESKRNTKGTLQEDLILPEATAGSNDVPLPSSSGPIALGIQGVVAEVQKPAYTRLKIDEPRSEVKKYLANRKSVIRPYATLTQGSLESGSTFGREADIDEAIATKTVVTAPISQYNSVVKAREGGGLEAPNKPRDTATERQPDLRRFVKADFDPLLAILPESEAVVLESTRLHDLRNVMETIPDDFSFIHQSVVAWDTRAKKQREENDKERHARQIESEQRIDSLFDDHEIGYGDISELESEFKRSEAARKADEDRLEYQMFVTDVFTLVWTRIHFELDQLIPHYEQYCDLMNRTLAGKDMFEQSDQGLALASTMSLFLTLHQKLEIRYQKAFEAVLERDRRLKKTEISPWYTLSNITKVKQLEKQFEDAEKKAIIEYCQQRDSRANRLMDVLDQNTLRGVGANQDYMGAIWKAVGRIASGRAFASISDPSEPTAGIEEVEKAKTVTTMLATSSEHIVQTFHVADMLLNSAAYEVSVARAKVEDKTDMASLAKLKEARAKEDQKLMRELEHRLALIRQDTRRTNDEIVKLMLFLGITNGRAGSTPTMQAGVVDPGHEARIRKALEEAKKRNASKESGG